MVSAMTWKPNWDLSTIPDADLYAELGRRRAALRKEHGGGRPKTLRRCAKCGVRAGAREMRVHRCA